MTSTAPRRSLEQLEDRDDFLHRHIGPDDTEVAGMLETLGLASLDALIEQSVPADLRSSGPFNLPPPRSERVIEDTLRRMRSGNQVYTSLIGMGYYDTILPNVI